MATRPTIRKNILLLWVQRWEIATTEETPSFSELSFFFINNILVQKNHKKLEELHSTFFIREPSQKKETILFIATLNPIIINLIFHNTYL